jgi:hypothetical protein
MNTNTTIAIKPATSGLKVRSNVAAGGLSQNNHSIAIKPATSGLKVRSNVAAGGLSQNNHSRRLAA